MSTFSFRARTPRRFPDPVFPGCVRHVFFCAAQDVPGGLPKGPNPRTQEDIDRGIYRDVKRSLYNEDCTPNSFHLKNKGITVIAQDVLKGESEEALAILFSSDDQGIVDGAHTYELLLRNKEEIAELNAHGEAAINQFVKFEVLTGLPDGLTPEVAGGLNTAVQVQRMSLANLEREFDWIKSELKESDFLRHVAFMQNEQKDHDVRDVLRWLYLFNVRQFPNKGGGYPIKAYTSKEGVLKDYLDTKNGNSTNYKSLRGILKEILILHDTVSAQAVELYNQGGGRKGGKLKFVEKAASQSRLFSFPFISEQGEYRLYDGALMPMLGAFRAAVTENPTSGQIEWREGFECVLELWQASAKELMEATQETSEELGRNPNAIGKSKKHWAYLHNLLDRRLR